MHEASIARSILDMAEEQCRKAGYNRVLSIEVRIGSASGVLPHALASAFDMIKLDTPSSGASLVIREVPLGGSCRGCGRRFTTDEQFILQCPICRSNDFRLDTGRELDVLEIDVE